MGGEANSTDHDLLDKFLNVVLDHYKDGVISWRSAHSALSHAFALASDQDGTMDHHMRAFLSRNPRDDL